MKKIILCSLIFISTFTKSQNLPACDSLVINCCSFDSLGFNTLTLFADNHSSVLFDYPGFVLFNAAMDTIAKETVVYFGIGTGFQPHTLNIVAPLILPFNGELKLYTGFYTDLACSFPFYIPDTVNGVSALKETEIKVFPNPAQDEVSIMYENVNHAEVWWLTMYDITGRKVLELDVDHPPLIIPLNEMTEGLYFLKINDRDQREYYSGKLMVAGNRNK